MRLHREIQTARWGERCSSRSQASGARALAPPRPSLPARGACPQALAAILCAIAEDSEASAHRRRNG